MASRHHLELVNAVVDDALAQAGATLDDVELVAVTQGPGLVGALLIGVATAKALAASRRLPLAAVDHLQGHVAANFLGAAVRAAVPVPDRLRRAHAAGAGRPTTRATRRSARRSTTPPARRSTRARGCSGSATRAARRCRSCAASGDPTAFTFPTAAQRRRPRLLLRRPEDRAALQGARPRPGGDRRAARADLAASYEHAIVEALIAPRRARAGRTRPSRAWRSAAASPPTGCCASARAALGVAVHVPPRRAVHGQRGDDRLRRALGASPRRSRTTSALDAYATRRAA